MHKNNSIKALFIMLLILASTAYFGCEKKTSETEELHDKDSVASAAGEASGNQPDPVTEQQIKIPDITGKWTGLFDRRSTVMEITEQTDSSFSGKISISYRESIHQDVKGSFSPATMKMTMTDQLHSRFQGNYTGSLSENSKNFSGFFTLNRDGSKYSFNLNKK